MAALGLPDRPAKGQSHFIFTRSDLQTEAASSSPPRPAVWFPDWAGALTRADLPVPVRQQYRRAIVEYLRFCKQTRQRATVGSARHFMEGMEAQRQLGAANLAT